MNHTTCTRANRWLRDDHLPSASGNIPTVEKNPLWNGQRCDLLANAATQKKYCHLGGVVDVNRFADGRGIPFAGVCTVLQNRLQAAQILRASVVRACCCINFSSGAQPDGPPFALFLA